MGVLLRTVTRSLTGSLPSLYRSQSAGCYARTIEARGRSLVSQDELVIAIVLLLAWGFGIAALVLD